jgi:predicted metalloprotease
VDARIVGQRQEWFMTGYERDRVGYCDTFNGAI